MKLTSQTFVGNLFNADVLTGAPAAIPSESIATNHEVWMRQEDCNGSWLGVSSRNRSDLAPEFNSLVREGNDVRSRTFVRCAAIRHLPSLSNRGQTRC